MYILNVNTKWQIYTTEFEWKKYSNGNRGGQPLYQQKKMFSDNATNFTGDTTQDEQS